jgi:hypothetical protein
MVACLARSCIPPSLGATTYIISIIFESYFCQQKQPPNEIHNDFMFNLHTQHITINKSAETMQLIEHRTCCYFLDSLVPISCGQCLQLASGLTKPLGMQVVQYQHCLVSISTLYVIVTKTVCFHLTWAGISSATYQCRHVIVRANPAKLYMRSVNCPGNHSRYH